MSLNWEESDLKTQGLSQDLANRQVEEYPSQAMWLDKRINNKLEQMERLKAIAEKVTVDFTQEKVSGGKAATTSPMEDATVKLIDLSYEINYS